MPPIKIIYNKKFCSTIEIIAGEYNGYFATYKYNVSNNFPFWIEDQCNFTALIINGIIMCDH